MGIFGGNKPVQLVARKDLKGQPGHNQGLDEIIDTKVVHNNAEMLRKAPPATKASPGVASPAN